MSRRMDREGVHRSHTQSVQNRRFWEDPRCKEDDHGWVQPFANWQGWQGLNHAIYALRCVLIWKRLPTALVGPLLRDDGSLDREQLNRGSTLARIESDMRTFHFSLRRSRQCDRPILP